jgi:hypothetical protein
MAKELTREEIAERSFKRWVRFWIFYVFIIVLTAGWSWHRTCSDADADAGRWFCSVAMGVVWPAYWATLAGIVVMDPDGPIFSFKPPTIRFEIK